jgi:phosphonatase-like hydrolase
MTPLELVVFDMAGTTVRDDGQVPDAFAAALLHHGIEATAEQVRSVRGSSKREALRRFLPDTVEGASRLDDVYAFFRRDLAGRYSSGGVHAVPGAEAAFQALRSRGVRVALNTGFDRDTTSLLLDALGWSRGAVDAVVCGDDVPVGRPAPYLIFRAMEATGILPVRSVANVGDTALDLQAGYNAGAGWNIGVLSGAHDRETLRSVPHTHLIASVGVLESVWGSPVQ